MTDGTTFLLKKETISDIDSAQEEVTFLHEKGVLDFSTQATVNRRLRTLRGVIEEDNSLMAFAVVQIGLDQIRRDFNRAKEHDSRCPVRLAAVVGKNGEMIWPWQTAEAELTWKRVAMTAASRSPLALASVIITWLLINSDLVKQIVNCAPVK